MYSEILAAAVGAIVGSVVSAVFLSRSEKKAALRNAYGNVFAAVYSLMACRSTENMSKLVAANESAAFICSHDALDKMVEMVEVLETNDEDAIIECLCQLRDLAHQDVGTQFSGHPCQRPDNRSGNGAG